MQQAGIYLKQIIPMQEEIKSLRVRKHDLYLTITALGSMDYAKDRVQTSVTNAAEDRIIKMLDKQQDINMRIDYLNSEIKRRTKEIKSLGGLDGAILYSRYVVGMSLEKIARHYSLTYQAVKNRQHRALRKFEKLYLDY